MGVVPLLTITSPSSQSSSTLSDDFEYNDDKEGSGFLRNDEESGFLQNNEEPINLDKQNHSYIHSQLQHNQQGPSSQEEHTQEDIDHQTRIIHNHTESFLNTDSEIFFCGPLVQIH